MSLVWPNRSLALERLDVEQLDPPTASHVLQNLETINRYLGGVRTTLFHFKRFSKGWKPGQTLRILDWGVGGADLPRALVRWGRRAGFQIEMTGIEQDPVIVQIARERCAAYPEIQILQTDAFAYSPAAGYFDYAMSSLTLHHLSDDAIVALLKRSDAFATKGIVMNDLMRSVRAWAWIWALSRIAGMHPMVQHDGPLSVKRAFTKNELHAYIQKTSLPYLRVYSHFGYRYSLAGEKNV